MPDEIRGAYAPQWHDVHAYALAHPENMTDEQPYAPPVLTFENAKAAKLSRINAAADKAISALTATYPDRKLSTFDKQEAEARAYAADATASTSFLSALVKRGVSSFPSLSDSSSQRQMQSPRCSRELETR